MTWLRKGFLFVLSLLLLISLVGGVAALNIDRDIANPARLESRLAASGIYDRAAGIILQQAEKSSSNSGDSGTISFNDPAVQQAAASAFSPSLVQKEVNTFLNGNYDWLSGKKPVPDFNVDLTSAKENFAKQVGQATQAHLGSLPACTPEQLAQLPIPVDPLTLNCRPATLDPKAEGDRVAQEINSSSDFLANPVITANSLNQQTQPMQTDGSQPQQGQPYYQKLSWLPTAYQIGLKLPWLLGALALLCITGIVFIASSRRRGVRKVGAVFLLAGLALVGVKFLADASVNKLASFAADNFALAGLKQPLNDLVHKIEPQLVRGYLLFGILFVVIAVVIFALLFISRHRTARSAAEPAAADNPQADFSAQTEGNPLDAVRRLAPRHQPTAPPLGNQDPQPQPNRPGPLGKNPPRRKPPKLIQ